MDIHHSIMVAALELAAVGADHLDSAVWMTHIQNVDRAVQVALHSPNPTRINPSTTNNLQSAIDNGELDAFPSDDDDYFDAYIPDSLQPTTSNLKDHPHAPVFTEPLPSVPPPPPSTTHPDTSNEARSAEADALTQRTAQVGEPTTIGALPGNADGALAAASSQPELLPLSDAGLQDRGDPAVLGFVPSIIEPAPPSGSSQSVLRDAPPTIAADRATASTPLLAPTSVSFSASAASFFPSPASASASSSSQPIAGPSNPVRRQPKAAIYVPRTSRVTLPDGATAPSSGLPLPFLRPRDPSSALPSYKEAPPERPKRVVFAKAKPPVSVNPSWIAASERSDANAKAAKAQAGRIVASNGTGTSGPIVVPSRWTAPAPATVARPRRRENPNTASSQSSAKLGAPSPDAKSHADVIRGTIVEAWEVQTADLPRLAQYSATAERPPKVRRQFLLCGHSGYLLLSLEAKAHASACVRPRQYHVPRCFGPGAKCRRFEADYRDGTLPRL